MHSRIGQPPNPSHRDSPFTLVPVMVGVLDAESEANYGAVFAKYLEDPANLFVISSDFCHWGQRFDYFYYNASQVRSTVFRADTGQNALAFLGMCLLMISTRCTTSPPHDCMQHSHPMHIPSCCTCRCITSHPATRQPHHTLRDPYTSLCGGLITWVWTL